MLLDKYVLVVTFFVFTTKNAQPFILLTANVGDIKKIAQKFVSDDLADKLAHTVVQVINNLNNKKGTNIDDELSKIEFTTQRHEDLFKNEKYERHNQYNIPKSDQQRFKKATRSPDEDFTFDDSRETHSIYKDDHRKPTTKYLNNWEMNVKSQDATKLSSREEPIAAIKSVNHQQRQQHDLHTRTTKKPMEYIIHTTRHNYESNEVKSRYVPEIKPILSPQLRQENEKGFDNNPSSDLKRKKKRNRSELKRSDEQYLMERNQSNDQRASENRETEVTTYKGKYEFDQYDNLNYPKIGSYIATSGPVVLPARPVHVERRKKQWWEQDLPDRRKNKNY